MKVFVFSIHIWMTTQDQPHENLIFPEEVPHRENTEGMIIKINLFIIILF